MNPYRVVGLRASTAALVKLVRLIPASRWDEKLDQERFTPREVIAHMADWEPIFGERIRRGANEDGYVVTVFDEGQRAIEFRYHVREVRDSIRDFESAREKTLALIESLTAEQMARKFQHPERGEMTVADASAMLLGHDAYHIEQLLQYLEHDAVGTW